ncbi:MAG: ribonucleoside triphosphate reductase [Candidatus Pacearchaeota archaeon]
MLKKIRKRDGSLVPFSIEKIANAIEKALIATQEAGKNSEEIKKIAKELAQKIVVIVEDQLAPGQIPSVEGIQDVVERVLMREGYVETAKAYILYRKQHADIRQVGELLTNIKRVEDYLMGQDWRIKENSNMTYSLQGLNYHVSSFITAQYWLNKIYPPEVRALHTNGDIHIHDLGVLAPYCVGWDLKDLLLTGFRGVYGKIDSKPAKHFKVALGQVVNFFYTLQGEAAGAQALSNFDTLLAPFIRYDGLGYKEVKQALQEFMFNINVPTRVGFQTPFTNITLDLKVPQFMKNEPVIIGGQPMDKTYGDFQEEMDIFNRALTEVYTHGDDVGRVFTFPIPTYNITKDFDWDNPKYDSIWEMTAKYGVPYFSNFINSDMKPEDARSMCCRLRLDNRQLNKRGGGLFGANPLTGSIGVVTINLPRIGYLSKTETEFIERLGKVMDISKESLEIKRKVLEEFTDRGLYPYSKFYLREMKKMYGKYWVNHFSTIGLVGMNEACMNLFGLDIGTERGRAFAERVLDFMRDKIAQYQQETGNFYNLEATPAEGTSYRLARIDKKTFPDIIVANNDAVARDGAEPYYTNSTHLPVNYTDDLFRALELQDSLQTKYTGGTVFHAFIGESLPSKEAIKTLVKRICENFKLPYFTITPTFSICPNHGYFFGQHFLCPQCKGKCEVYSRVVGYLRPVDQWNDGKRTEFMDRKTFDTALKTIKMMD